MPRITLMSSLGIRPHFTQILDLDVEAARERITLRAAAHEGRCEVKNFPGFVCLRVPVAERRYWSPRLNLSLEPHEGGRTRVEGIYGPNANMWSSFLYAWLLVGSVGLFSGILGACQYRLNMTPWGLWVFAVMAVLALTLYALARFGRRMGEVQTRQLHEIYQECAGKPVEVE